jgi:hypothetical protein
VDEESRRERLHGEERILLKDKLIEKIKMGINSKYLRQFKLIAKLVRIQNEFLIKRIELDDWEKLKTPDIVIVTELN